jgi:hypothetical protein
VWSLLPENLLGLAALEVVRGVARVRNGGAGIDVAWETKSMEASRERDVLPKNDRG